MNETPNEDAYALKTATARMAAAPELPYQPPRPRSYTPRIALAGAGGISFAHLDAYRSAGLDVALIYNRTLEKAVARRDAFFPDAEVTDDFAAVLARDDIEVVDITIHPAEREMMIEKALGAGKHVLSQKPYVLELDIANGLRISRTAKASGSPSTRMAAGHRTSLTCARRFGRA